jgi:hypothetical protein
MLYDWPKIKSIDMFDVYDLDSSLVCLLLVSSQGHEYLQHVEEIYVWVGCGLITNKERNEFNRNIDRGE